MNVKMAHSTAICLFIVALSLSGCFGIAVQYPKECNNESLPGFSTKEEVVAKWGKPGKITITSTSEETWIYEKDIWCGLIPMWGVPVPFILPACDGYDRIDFRGKEAIKLQTRHVALTGGGASFFPVLIPVPFALDSPNCQHLLPERLRESIVPGKSVSLDVIIDMPEHKQDPDYIGMATMLREGLSAEFVTWGIFKDVVPATSYADYDMVVTLTSARIEHRWFNKGYSDIYAKTESKIVYRETNQIIGNFEVVSRAHTKGFSPETWDIFTDKANTDPTVSGNPSIQEVVNMLVNEISINLRK
jgi:hypothetical protein